ncbi:MAG: hypothetical protein WC496_09265 [Phycisphaerae bacterium]|jgi:hypothetical protein
MKPPVHKNIDRQKSATARNTAQRKKLIVALLLMAVMAVMWIRVFAGKNKPASASAAVSSVVNPLLPQAQSQKMEYIELPYIPQRHDIIANDFFTTKNFKKFKRQDQYTTNNRQVNLAETMDEKFDTPAAAAAASLRLIAIVNDKKPQAFIENRLFEKGQSFRFKFDGQVYRFRVTKILADRVELDCNGIIITKKIPQPF